MQDLGNSEWPHALDPRSRKSPKEFEPFGLPPGGEALAAWGSSIPSAPVHFITASLLCQLITASLLCQLITASLLYQLITASLLCQCITASLQPQIITALHPVITASRGQESRNRPLENPQKGLRRSRAPKAVRRGITSGPPDTSSYRRRLEPVSTKAD